MKIAPKKIHHGWQRQYRERCAPRQGERVFQIVRGESDLRILVGGGQEEQTQQELAAHMCQTLERLRADVSSWARVYPEFRTSLAPLPLPENAPQVIQRMYAGAALAAVGPFAAVAGTISQMLVEAHKEQFSDIIVENGGDVYMHSSKERVVALLAQPQSVENAEDSAHDGTAYLGLRFTEQDFPLALCASSATIGHSLSLGRGELAVVRARDGALADAVATAMGNRLKGASSVQQALDFGQSIEGVEGLFVQCDDALGLWGAMELVAL